MDELLASSLSATESDHSGRVQSLVRAFGILDALADKDDGLTLTEIAKSVDLPRSTAHRLLSTMQALRYVRFDQSTNRWAIGVQAFTVGAAFAQTRDLAKLGRSIMRSLVMDARETVNISVMHSDGVCYVAQMRASERGSALARPGGKLPVHTSASGKAILAYLPEKEVDNFLATKRLVARTRLSITEPQRLKAELGAIRTRGVAVDDQENAPDMRCLAAVVFDEEQRPHASLSISGPISRLSDDRLGDLGEALAAAARRMTAEIGGRVAA